MAKTSMFGGHLPSAELPTSPTGTRLLYGKDQKNNENADPSAAVSCFSVKGSSTCQSPSPSNKADTQDKFSAGPPGAMSFHERMAQ